ncbi:hypothetical protein B0E43_19615 [Algoriphagus sp. A40]|nr:hypothetical protein B0E43_19615 [Algoriphagus sp. A40]
MKEDRNKGDTQFSGLSLQLDQEETSRFRESLIRLLDRIEVQASDQVQLNDIKEIFKLLEYFSKES